jgi:hypothetical protein
MRGSFDSLRMTVLISNPDSCLIVSWHFSSLLLIGIALGGLLSDALGQAQEGARGVR